ncbi:MAG: extensin family protein [Hyphomicrobiaceae bacterium]|nr:extensin family protein [Hyphomicrobiaceae bacterium]
MYVSRLTSLFLIGSSAFALLSGCGKGGDSPDFVAKYEPWRAQEERQCLASGLVRPNRFLQTRSALGGPSACGAEQPFLMSGADGGRVELKPAATLRCPMIPAVDHWVRTVVSPAAMRYFGQPVHTLKVAASYGCRPINHQSGAKLSEHGHANAIDISEFQIADGRRVTVKNGWWGDPRERAFLRSVHRGGCDTFTTVLGPLADRHHHDHIHLDLARHGRSGTGRVCK